MWHYTQKDWKGSYVRYYPPTVPGTSKDMGILLTYASTKDLGDAPTEIPRDCWWYYNDLDRDDPILVEVVEELGEKANARFAKLAITEVPDGVSWGIEEYDGQEWVSETHRTW